MISGAHVVIYSKNAEADRAFFRDVLGFKSVDAGHGWLIFALPPGEAAFHPSAENGPHELYFVWDGLDHEGVFRNWLVRLALDESLSVIVPLNANVVTLRAPEKGPAFVFFV